MAILNRPNDEERRKKVEAKEKLKKKTEEAKSIAQKSQQVVNQYKHIEVWVIKNLKIVSLQLDEIITKPKRGKILALLMAIVMYFTITGQLLPSVFSVPRAGEVLEDVAVQVVGNDVYEVSGIPSVVDISLVGDLSDIQMTKAQNKYEVVADLKGLSEGVHNVELKVNNVSSRLKTTVNPNSVSVVLKKKESKVFKLSYEYVNQDKKDAQYILGIPTFEFNEVTVTASKDTLDMISTVKAIIDTTGVFETFDREVSIVAYDQKGQRMDVQIIPDKVKVSVPVTSPYKEVPIFITPDGVVPNGKAVADISLDHDTVRVYGSDEELQKIDRIEIKIDATQLTSDTNKFTNAILLPAGISKSSITTVNVTITVEDKVSRIIDSIPIKYKDNENGYKPNFVSDVYASVTIEGSKTRVAAFSASDLDIYINMAGVGLGSQEVDVIVINTGDQTIIVTLTSKEKIRVDVTQ